jgi:hypothetical protein
VGATDKRVGHGSNRVARERVATAAELVTAAERSRRERKER